MEDMMRAITVATRSLDAAGMSFNSTPFKIINVLISMIPEILDDNVYNMKPEVSR